MCCHREKPIPTNIQYFGAVFMKTKLKKKESKLVKSLLTVVNIDYLLFYTTKMKKKKTATVNLKPTNRQLKSVDDSDPFSTPARRRRIIADVAIFLLRNYCIKACHNVSRFRQETKAAIRIQSKYRQIRARLLRMELYVQRQNYCALVIQCCYRCWKASKDVWKRRRLRRNLLRQQAAVQIQCSWRMFYARYILKLLRQKYLDFQNTCVIAIQKRLRGWRGRQKYNNIKHERQTIDMYRNKSCIAIQTQVRRFQALKKYKILSITCKAKRKIYQNVILWWNTRYQIRYVAAMKIQTRYRLYKNKRHESNLLNSHDNNSNLNPIFNHKYDNNNISNNFPWPLDEKRHDIRYPDMNNIEDHCHENNADDHNNNNTHNNKKSSLITTNAQKRKEVIISIPLYLFNHLINSSTSDIVTWCQLHHLLTTQSNHTYAVGIIVSDMLQVQENEKEDSNSVVFDDSNSYCKKTNDMSCVTSAMDGWEKVKPNIRSGSEPKDLMTSSRHENTGNIYSDPNNIEDDESTPIVSIEMLENITIKKTLSQILVCVPYDMKGITNDWMNNIDIGSNLSFHNMESKLMSCVIRLVAMTQPNSNDINNNPDESNAIINNSNRKLSYHQNLQPTVSSSNSISGEDDVNSAKHRGITDAASKDHHRRNSRILDIIDKVLNNEYVNSAADVCGRVGVDGVKSIRGSFTVSDSGVVQWIETLSVKEKENETNRLRSDGVEGNNDGNVLMNETEANYTAQSNDENHSIYWDIADMSGVMGRMARGDHNSYLRREKTQDDLHRLAIRIQVCMYITLCVSLALLYLLYVCRIKYLHNFIILIL